jgi:hypothetical protein
MVLQQDNAPAHTAVSVTQRKKKWILLMEQSSYSPDFTPCNFLSTPNHNIFLKGMHTGSLQESSHVDTSAKSNIRRCVPYILPNAEKTTASSIAANNNN